MSHGWFYLPFVQEGKHGGCEGAFRMELWAITAGMSRRSPVTANANTGLELQQWLEEDGWTQAETWAVKKTNDDLLRLHYSTLHNRNYLFNPDMNI